MVYAGDLGRDGYGDREEVYRFDLDTGVDGMVGRNVLGLQHEGVEMCKAWGKASVLR